MKRQEAIREIVREQNVQRIDSKKLAQTKNML
jgi:hypothetical protein